MCVPYVWVVFKTSSCHWDDRHKLELERGKIVKNHDELWITYHPRDFRYMTHSFLWWFIVAVGSMSTEPENMATWRGTREELKKDQNRSMPRAAMTGQIQDLFSGNIWLVFIVKGLRKKPSRGNNQERERQSSHGHGYGLWMSPAVSFKLQVVEKPSDTVMFSCENWCPADNAWSIARNSKKY